MRPRILAYGNDPILLTTRRLVLEKARYRVFTSLEFSDAMLVLLNQQIDVLLLCHSLHDDERRGILETARAITQDVKCVILHYDGRAVPMEDAEVVEGLEGPNTLLRAIGKLLTHKAERHTVA
jgi:DNA-binding response OmpR family regulator